MQIAYILFGVMAPLPTYFRAPLLENMPPRENILYRSQSDGLTGRSQSEVNRERSRLARRRPKKDKRKVIRKKNQKRIKKKSSSFTFTPRYTRVNVKVKV
jgi:hypothetical protein